MNQLYGFTYKYNIGVPSIQDYKVILDILNKKGSVIKTTYEQGSKNKLHIHGIVYLPHNVYFKQLCPLGYHSHFEEIYDEAGWLKYCTKEVTQDLNWFKTNYAF